MPQNIETRAEQNDDLGLTSATAVVEELRSSVDTFRTEHEQRQQQLAERLDQIETRLNRPAIQTRDNRHDEGDLEMRAFENFARYGREALSADEQRALTTDGANAGATLVPEQFLNELVKNLVEFSPMRQVARVQPVSGSPVKLPRRTAALQAAWVAEGDQSTGSQPTYGQHSIDVHEARVHVDVSNQLLEDSAFNLAAELAQDFAEEFGRLEGAAFVAGTGSGQPEGFLTSSDFQTMDASGAAITADDLIDLYHSVPSIFAGRGSWLMNRATMGAIRKLKDGEGRYVWQDSLAAGNPATVLGRPVIEMPDLPDVAAEAVPLAFGDWNAGYRIFDRVGLSVLRDPYSRGSYGEVRFLARRRVGGLLVNAEAVTGLAMPA